MSLERWMSPYVRTLRASVVLLVAACHCFLSKVAAENTQSTSAPAPVVNDSVVAVVTIASPKSIARAFPGFFATFSTLPPASGTELVVWVPDGDPEGCQEGGLPSVPVGAKVIAMLRRGTCTFVEKARRAQAAGAEGLVIVSDTDQYLMIQDNHTREALGLSILVLDVAKSDGDVLIEWAQAHSNDPISLNLAVYEPQIWNLSELVVILLGTSLVVAGAFFATSDLRVNSPLAPIASEEVVDVTSELALGFCVMGSCMLVVLFFLMKYMIYFIIFGFCCGGFSCLQQIGSACLAYQVPSLRQRTTSIPFIGAVTSADIIALFPAGGLVVSWLVLRNTHQGWIFQDIIGAGFLCWMQRTLRLPNMKVATLLLSIMFFFDIFWVFLSPLLFHKSVMVEVARGGGTGEAVPMLLRVPAIGDPIGNDRMLGFGDIALPGLLVSYLRRHDVLSKRTLSEGYFVPSVVGYFVGLCVTIVALMVMRMGQPALLYLVPGTLGTTLLLGLCRGELQNLWDGRPCKSRGSAGAESLATNDTGELEPVT